MARPRNSIVMKHSNYIYLYNNIKKHQEQGSHDWDDDLDIINDLIKEYGTSSEDMIMGIYRSVERNWNEIKDSSKYRW